MEQKILIRTYNKSDRDLINQFREQTFLEGNTSLTYKKYNPDILDGETFMFFIDDELASISVVERSTTYTENTDVGRICRYHILKKFRHSNAGFKMLPHQVEWAIKHGYRLLYWTHNITNRALNAMYQHKRIMPYKQHYFDDPLYKSFIWKEDLRFITGDVTQHVYAKYIDPNYIWEPKGQMIRYRA